MGGFGENTEAASSQTDDNFEGRDSDGGKKRA